MNSKIEKITQVTNDGFHNAFPGMTRFKGALYLSYRTSTGHAMNDGKICLKRSFDNGENWEDLQTTLTDKNYYEGFMIEFKGKLFMFGGAYPRDIEHPVWMHECRQYVSVSENGTDWSTPKEVAPPFAMRFWHPIVIGDLLYVASYSCFKNFRGTKMEVDLLSSEDGFTWKWVSQISDLPAGNETSILYDGENIHAFIRNERGTLRMKHTCDGDFTRWSDEEDLQVGLQGPMAYEINGRRFLSGRFRGASPRLGGSFTDRSQTRFRTYVYVPQIKLFVEYADFPSGFDCAYSESVPLDGNRMLTAYYSQHGHGSKEGFRDMEGGSDIFLATVRTDMTPEWGKLTPGAMAYLDKIGVSYK